jgi:2,4-dienoyl-CoA reductase-like NADH-dependent reductase (Old Yellow Enzyme family)
VSDAFIAHHVAKARGGTGWIGHETYLLDTPMPDLTLEDMSLGGGTLRFPMYMMPTFVDDIARFNEAVREAGSVAVYQLTHLNNATAASSVPVVEAYDMIPHAMVDDEIEHIINSYVRAAGQFLAAGVDGIEIHCAHESVPQTFLSPAMNKRTDRWGGDAKARTLLLREIVTRVKEKIGDAMALGIRINGQEGREDGYTLLEMRKMVDHVCKTGALDFINVDVGHCWGPRSYVQPSYYGHAEHREVGRALKVDQKIPILLSGRINDCGVAEQLLKAGECDLVGMTRAGIADPEFANKAREGRLVEIRRCIACNRCIGEVIHGRGNMGPTCSVNPEIGNEIYWQENFKPAEKPRRVVIVGGGPAGLETARISAMRGHEVILLEKSLGIGGQVRLAARAPGRDTFDDFIIYEENQMKIQGIDVRLGKEVGMSDVLALEPDVVVCCTGSIPRVPDTPGINSPHVVQGWDVLAGKVRLGDRVAVVSQEDYFETPNVADYIASQGKQVEIFHKWTAIAADVDRYSLGAVMGRLEENQVEIHTGLRLAGVDTDKTEFFSAFSSSGTTYSFNGFDNIVLVYGSVPDPRLYYELLAEGSVETLHLVGAAWLPRRMAEATQHGMRVAMAI